MGEVAFAAWRGVLYQEKRKTLNSRIWKVGGVVVPCVRSDVSVTFVCVYVCVCVCVYVCVCVFEVESGMPLINSLKTDETSCSFGVDLFS